MKSWPLVSHALILCLCGCNCTPLPSCPAWEKRGTEPPTSPPCPLQVKYKRLEKGTFVEFQPLSRGFHEAVGGDVRHVLETALMKHWWVL